METDAKTPSGQPVAARDARALGGGAADGASRRALVRHDVVVVGGGLVGASLAIALERAGVDVAMVEAAPAGALPAVFDQRNLSFAEATVNALSALGVMQRLRLPPAPIRRIHASRNGDFGRVVLEAADYGRDRFGQVVVASDFGQALESRLAELRGFTRYRPARFLGFEGADVDGERSEDTQGDARVLRVADAGGERRIAARLVVAADGTRSGVRSALGIGVREHDYGQTLFVARLRTARAPDGTAWERFGADGPTALLPRGDGHYGVVHGVASDEAEAVAALDDAAWLARLQRAFGWRAGAFLAIGPRSAHPALRVVADRCVAPRAALVGNAAQTLHPVGAQGFNLGLRDALILAELIGDGAGGDPGADALLQAYALRRMRDRERTLAFSDGLARVTATEEPLLRPLRSLGLAAVQRLPTLQARVVGGAMGYRGDVPRLCRGVDA
jgi:2-octaprenyl-6-methoxyphenol hydroxylase